MEWKKLPEAEFEVMKVVWDNQPPITTGIIMEHLGKRKGWKAQTVISLMTRLVDRGFLKTEKTGKERKYFSLINRDDYLKFETSNFMKQYHENSLIKLFNAFHDNNALSDKDIDDLLQWIKEYKKK